MDRRLALKGFVLAAGGSLVAHAATAQTPNTVLPMLDPDYFDPTGDPPPDVLVGTSPALTEEEKIGRQVIDAAPASGGLADLEYYFSNLTAHNRDGEPYRAQWDVRWNPVIVHFFSATTTKAHGDTVAWCAAFQNWCLKRLGYKTTDSASSGSFRKYGNPVHTPQPGDLVVFEALDPDEAAQGHGHVAVFLYETKEKTYVLGGNQHQGKKFSSVNVSSFPKIGYMKINSYQRPQRA